GMLYEMLLGKVPFAGATVGEILMKHLTAQPEVDALPAPFPDVIRKALCKDPKDRYQTVSAMTAALFSASQLGRDIANFEPASLSIAAAQIAVRSPGGVAVGGGSSNVGRDFSPAAPPIVDPRRFGQTPSPRGERLAGAADKVEAAVHGALGAIDGVRTGQPTFPPRTRLTTGLLGVILGSFGVHRFYTGYNRIGVVQIVATCLSGGLAGLWGVIEGIMILA